MKLSMESIRDADAFRGFHLPAYNPLIVAENTKKRPQWLHFGPGNLFRMFPAVLCQRLLEEGRMDTGIVCCEAYDGEIISHYRDFDNLSIAVTLQANGAMDREIVASMAETLYLDADRDRVAEVIQNPSLQLISFTITEKGYSLEDANHQLKPDAAADMKKGPEGCTSFFGQLVGMLLKRGRDCGRPLALVSLDNCSENGEKLKSAVTKIAKAWLEGGKISEDDYAYLTEKLSFPWTMIDKITPRPDPAVRAALEAEGLCGMEPAVTEKHSYVAPFVNAEKPQYLIIEDQFPNGRPKLEDAGVIFADRETVRRAERMKVTSCLNPLHTCLAIFGCLLGYERIADEMKDRELKNFAERLGREEGLPYAPDPGVIRPEDFLDEVLRERLPNPYLADTPQRIATDTSQKIPVRFGETIKSCMASKEHDVSELKLIPLVLAGYLRYLMGVDDAGKPMALSPDPMLENLQGKMAGIRLGEPFDEERLRPILSDETLFGVNLYESCLAERVIGCFKELAAGPGAVRATLKKYFG